MYIGSTYEELDTRLKWHLSNEKSSVFKNKDKEPKIKLIVSAPSKDKKNLERVEIRYIEEYALEYGDKLLNKRSNALKKYGKPNRTKV